MTDMSPDSRSPRRFVLLDRDGTIIVERHYLADPAGVELLPGAAAGLRRLRELGFGLVVVSNQSGVARGYLTLETLERIHARLVELLAAEGVTLDGMYFCPHGPDTGCDCRKPLPGLILRAAADLGFDPRLAVVVGDKPCDVDLGRAVGARSVLVRTGYGREHEGAPGCQPDLVADDLRDVARLLEALDPDPLIDRGDRADAGLAS